MPGVGEYFVFPALTLSGPCDIMVFEGVPGGPLDCWRDLKSPAEHLAASKRFLDTYLPWEGARAAKAELTDAKGILAGAFAPTIRKPVMTLPSGKLVFGLGDAVVVNDPVTGQGSNNATKAAKVYLDAILAHGDAPYTRAWMEQTFERYWDYAKWVVQWTNSLLLPPRRTSCRCWARRSSRRGWPASSPTASIIRPATSLVERRRRGRRAAQAPPGRGARRLTARA